MRAITEFGEMAKVKAKATTTRGRPPKPTGEGINVRLDADLVTMGRYLAAQRGLALSELLSSLLRPTIAREFAKAAPDVTATKQSPA